MSNDIQLIPKYIGKYYPYVLSNTHTTVLKDIHLNIGNIRSVENYRQLYPSTIRLYENFIGVRFISNSIVLSILRNYTHIKEVEYTCISPITSKQFIIRMTYYLPSNNSNHWNSRVFDLFEHYLKALFIMFFYLERINSSSVKKLNKPLRIYYCPTEFPKRITRQSCRTKPFVFRPDNVNSGYTTTMHDGSGYIVIYRYEEFNRLLFHETIHYLGIDGDESKWNEFVEVGDEIRRSHNIEGRICLYESYTDLWAIFWNIHLNIYFNPKADFDALWIDELEHQRRLIEHSMFCIGNKTIREWMTRNPKTPSWRMDDTPSFDYYVLKHGAFIFGIREIQKRFPFAKTMWNKQTIRAWFDLCNSGLKSYYELYKPKNNEKDGYISSVMSNIGLKL
jgi:hypothetical protein